MSSKAIYLPFEYGDIELSEPGEGTFWKRLLPVDGEINYNGSKLRFTRHMLTEIVNSFNNRAYDQVPFQLATDKNEHNYDPERGRGEVEELKVTDKGLVGKFKLNPDGTKLIEGNNRLGVSVSVKKNYERADGKKFPYALQHVLGTIDPKVTGLGNWEVAQLSNSEHDEEVEDLTKEKIVGKVDKTGDSEDTVTIPKDEWEEVKAYVAKMKEGDAALDGILTVVDEEKGKETVNASNTPSLEIIELSNKFAASEYERYADRLKREGVPPAMIDSARKVLSVSDLVQLSNDGGENDPKVVIREILEQAKGTIDLSADIGHSQSQDGETEHDKWVREQLSSLFAD